MNTEEIILSHVEKANRRHVFENSCVVPDHVTNNYPHEYLKNAKVNHKLDSDKRIYFMINIGDMNSTNYSSSILILLNGL